MPATTLRNLVLIGYRGTGKSTVARLVAERLNWDWADADVELERRAGMSIAEIFATQGEPAFRDLEVAVLADLALREHLVVAAGGGAVMREETRTAWQEHQCAGVWLKASPMVLLERISADTVTATRRPKLTTLGDADEIAGLLAKREPWYRQCARWEVDTDQATPEQVAKQIVSCVERDFPVP